MYRRRKGCRYMPCLLDVLEQLDTFIGLESLADFVVLGVGRSKIELE